MSIHYSLCASLSGCLDLFFTLYILYTGGPHFEKFSGIHIFGLQTTNKAFQFQKGPPPIQFPTVFNQFPTGRNGSERVGTSRKRSETVGNGRKRSETVGNRFGGGGPMVSQMVFDCY